jgi:transcriptional regulator with XRE-family HTH domain
MRLQTYLNLHRITQAEFAESVNATYWAVRKWVYGERMPRPEALVKIEEATNGVVTARDFLPRRT